MRALVRSSLLLGSLVVASTGAAHGSRPPIHAKVAPPAPRARLASSTGAQRSRTGDALLCERAAEQEKTSVVLRTHRIVRGDSLSAIAALYSTTVAALAAANALQPDAVIRTGQELVIPQQARPGGGNDWLKYAHAPEQPGMLTLVAYRSQFHGKAVERGRVSATARREISALLGVKEAHAPVPERLIRLLVRVSDTFGGRPLRVVSGYRTSSYFADSRHKQGAAVDFSINGVPNAALRQYLLLFDDAGVGYYPNSSFVHLDVRGCAIQWVDYAGPGEAPRLHPYTPRFAGGSRFAKAPFGQAPSLSDLDEIAESTAAALDGRGRPATREVTEHETREHEAPEAAPDAP